MRRSHAGGHIVEVSHHPHALLQPGRANLLLEGGRVAGLGTGGPGQHKNNVLRGTARGEQARCLDDNALPLEGGQARRVQHQALRGQHPPALLQLANALRRHLLRCEPREVDAAIDRGDAAFRLAVSAPDRARRVAGIGDHHISARHHPIVEVLEPAAFLIGAVVGGDQRQAEAARGQQRTPGGRAAARMDQLHLLALGERAQPVAIPQNSCGIFRRRRKANELATGLDDARSQPAAFADHQSPAAGFDDRFRDLHGGDLGAARFQLRNDLRNCRPCVRQGCAPGLQSSGPFKHAVSRQRKRGARARQSRGLAIPRRHRMDKAWPIVS